MSILSNVPVASKRVVRDHLRPLANRYLRPTHALVLLRNAVGWNSRPRGHKEHLDAAIDWLRCCQDATGCGGSAAGYHLGGGWMPPYPETTGYIICTLLEYAQRYGAADLVERAVRMGDWEIEIQLPTGAVRGGVGINDYSIVFNTGQVILGWIALSEHSEERRFLDAACRAADWLVDIQSSDGAWRDCTFQGGTYAYHSRVAWPVLEVHRLTGQESYRRAGERHLCWLSSLWKPNGFFPNITLKRGEAPLTHFLAYTLRGCFECALLLESEVADTALEIVETASSELAESFQAHPLPSGLPPARINERWEPAADYSCLTGNAQLSILWRKLGRLTNNAELLRASDWLLEGLKRTQSLRSRNSGIRGGISGSYPINGPYMTSTYTSWATKFFADALSLAQAQQDDAGQGEPAGRSSRR